MNKKILRTGIAMAVLLLFRAAAAVEALPQAWQSQRPWEWWYQRHDEKLAEIQKHDADLVLLGDSITQYGERQGLYGYYFGNRKVLNLGVGGDGTEQVLWRLQNGEIDGIHPKLVSVMIGTNNAGNNTPDDIFLGIQEIVSELRQRQPKSKILLFSIFPRTEGPAYETVKAVNERLPALADGRFVTHVDLSACFLNADGSLKEELYYKDLLHLSDKGYQLWWSRMEPFVSQALGEPPLPPDPPCAVISSMRNGPRHLEKVAECAKGGYELVFIGDSMQINRELPGLAARYPQVVHLDINRAFPDEAGRLSRTIMPDLLHPNTEGYRIWAEAMEPMLSKLLDDEPVK